MIIPIIAVLIIASFTVGFVFFNKSYDRDIFELFGTIGRWLFIFLIVLTGIIFIEYMYFKAKGYTVDDKIAITKTFNEDRIASVMPILEKYPELEKEVVEGIDVQAFAVLGDVYPELKANESYNQQAELIKENIRKLEELEFEKIEIKEGLYRTSLFLWFLK